MKAARLPNAEPLAAINPETVQKLSDLHPHSDPPRFAPPTDLTPLLLTHRVLKKVLKRFPRGSAAGPSGFTFERLRAAIRGNRSCCDRTINFVNKVIGGEMLPMPEMLASLLVALQKSKGGIRPIAVCEVCLPFCSLCAIVLNDNAGCALAPKQLGVGVAG